MNYQNEGFTRDDIEVVRKSENSGEGADPDAIRADIRDTRERMGHTVDDLSERLNPDRLKAQAKQNLHDATIGKAEHMARVARHRVDDTRHGIMDSIRDNPIPAAMIGVGMGWLLVNSRRHDDYAYDTGYRSRGAMDVGYYSPIDYQEPSTFERTGSRAGGMRDQAMERGGELKHKAEDRVTEIAHDARDSLSDAADRAHDAFDNTAGRARSIADDVARQTRYRTHRVEDGFDDVMRDTPLAVGAAALAAGLALGLAAPSTRRESEVMGHARDQLVDRARDKAEEMKEDVTERVQAAGRASTSNL